MLRPVLRLQLTLPPVGVLQQRLQQSDLLVIRPFLGQFQHLVLMLQTDQMLSGGTRRTEAISGLTAAPLHRV